jgi:hypothetical protein
MSFVTPDTEISSSSPETPAIPLDWTRVQRKRTGTNSTEQCCEDPATCRLRHGTRPRLDLQEDDDSKTFTGLAVFCLHEMDPAWFQGYFIPKDSRRPWPLLAVQEEVEECLACADGGFRRINLSVYQPGVSSDKRITLGSVDWTGGDMIQLRHARVDMEADRLWTGKSSLSHIDRYFKGMISKLRSHYDVSRDLPILEWLPDVAVVVGEMTLVPILPDDEAGDMNSAR